MNTMPYDKFAEMTAEGLSRYIEEQDSFALEIRVMKAAKQSDFEVTHGGHYDDPVMSKPRQFDLRATMTGALNPLTQNNVNRLSMAIECKSLGKHYPLLVSRIKRSAAEATHDLLYLRSQIFTVEAKTVARSQVYPQNQWVGKSMTQVGWGDKEGLFKAGDAEVFDKWAQSINSSADLVASALVDSSINETAVIAVLVVSNGTLWAVDYDDEGRVASAPHPENDVTFYVDRTLKVQVGGRSCQFQATHLHICTEDGMKAFLSRLADHGDAAYNTFFLNT